MKTLRKYKRYEVQCDGQHHYNCWYKSGRLEKLGRCNCAWVKANQ